MSVALSHSPAEVMRQLLIDLGLGSDLDADGYTPAGTWPVYTDVEPSVPDNVMTVYDTTARRDGRSMIDGEVSQHWGVQVRVRGVDKPTSFAKAEAIRLALNERVNHNDVELEGHGYIVYVATNVNLLRMGLDNPSSKRFVFTVNALVALRETQ